MNKQTYQDNSYHHPHSTDQHYKNMQWGTNLQPANNAHMIYSPRSHTDYYASQKQPEDQMTVNVDYSQVAAVQTGFKRLKTNQIQILKQLRRQYEVLRNTQLESGKISTIRMQSDSAESIDDSVSKSRSDARSSSYSRAQRTRKKSRHKDLQVAALERKQMELMLNNSMKKIQQLLAAQIDLKKTISDLKNKLQAKESTMEEYEDAIRKYKSQIEKLNRVIDQSKRQNQNHRSKSKDLISSIGSLEGQLAIAQVQIKKKDQRLRVLEEEIYLEKNKFCNLELDLKKYKLQADLIERNHKQELSLLQRRITTSKGNLSMQRDDEIRKLTKELQLKEQRYRLLLNHFNQEKQQKQELIKNKSKEQEDFNDNKQSRYDKQYIQQLQIMIQNLKAQKSKTANASEQVLTSIIEKVNQMNSKPNQDLVSQINMLKKQLELIHQNAKTQTKPSVNEEELQQKLKQLEQSIEDQNVQKLYFIEDLKKIRAQLKEQKKQKQQAKSEVQELKFTLRRVEEQARKYSVELQTLRHLSEIDLTQSRQENQNIMIKSQQLQSRQQQLIQAKNDLSRVVDLHRVKISQYEDELKVTKRQLAQQQIKNFKIKEQLQLKLNLTKTEHEAQIARLHEQIEKLKKVNATEINQLVNEKLALEQKLLLKTQQLDRVNSQLSIYQKQKDNIYQQVRNQQDKKLKSMQEEHSNKVNQLAQKLKHLAVLNDQHMHLVQRNSHLQQEMIEMKRIVRHNRHINDGVDHLWSVKQAEYSNLHAILKELQ